MSHISPENITTSDHPDGWAVVQHLGVLSSHAVSGAGFATEFLASLTDVFGGQSDSLRKRFDEAVEVATAALLEKAANRGANWLIGFRLDTGEISGKGVMMLRVTATATAVLAQQRHPSSEATTHPSLVTSKQAAKLIEARQVAQNATPDALDNGDAVWELWQRTAVPETAIAALRWLRRRALVKTLVSPADDDVMRVGRLLSSLPRAVAGDAIYALAHELIHTRTQPPELHILQQLELLSMPRTADLLGRKEHFVFRWAVQSLRAHQHTYKLEDVRALTQCKSLLESILREEPAMQEVPGTLGFGKKLIWLCAEGHRVEASAKRCNECGIDARGFYALDHQPEAALTRVIELLGVLTHALHPSGHITPP